MPQRTPNEAKMKDTMKRIMVRSLGDHIVKFIERGQSCLVAIIDKWSW
jgi:hypothetical protein